LRRRSSAGSWAERESFSVLTMARSRPASTQRCRNTALSTSRPEGGRPKETLETPSAVLQPGRASLMRRRAATVSAALP